MVDSNAFLSSSPKPSNLAKLVFWLGFGYDNLKGYSLNRNFFSRYYFNKSMFELLDHRFQKLLWNFASVANVVNPFLYAMFDYGPGIGCKRR